CNDGAAPTCSSGKGSEFWSIGTKTWHHQRHAEPQDAFDQRVQRGLVRIQEREGFGALMPERAQFRHDDVVIDGEGSRRNQRAVIVDCKDSELLVPAVSLQTSGKPFMPQ